ncbi:hypothetical protein ES319_D03G075800v1 [Gossypium barbadense]|uniref:Thioredoxin domain-containing protein n=2 Tax=Gossypium TaxID=3633 RepID=A0A5J5S1C8_GOSBA|nr:hypothetical protein ES319_D03G075800v1 [Gossypium barbadense]TYG76053.1 hypothetical protein ES288_D03G082400v1 [Gossypium darwinii]
MCCKATFIFLLLRRSICRHLEDPINPIYHSNHLHLFHIHLLANPKNPGSSAKIVKQLQLKRLPKRPGQSLWLAVTHQFWWEFWAPWCGPCWMIEPVIAELAREYAGKISRNKLNTDDSPNNATQFGIRSIPIIMFFKNGEECIIGAVPKSSLAASIEKYIDN